MLTKAWTITHVRGIAIRIDASLGLIAALIAFSLWARFDQAADVGTWPAVVMGLVATALFFSSLLLHELGHAVEAQRHGLEVRSITLFLFGGVTESSFRFRRPTDELVMVAAGPATSFALAGLFAVVGWWAGVVGITVVTAVAGTLAWVNLVLGLFNLVPGAPLDGGRILQALIWQATGDRRRSMELAANVGRAIAGVFVGLGLALFLFAPGGGIDGAWLALIGWFLYRSAGAEVAFARLEGMLTGLPVRRLVPEGPGPLPPSATVYDAEMALVGARGDDVLAVVDHGRVVGLVEADRLPAVPTERRAVLPVTTVVRSVDGVARIDGDGDATALLELPPDEPLIVVAAGHDLGAVTPSRAIGIARRMSLLTPH